MDTFQLEMEHMDEIINNGKTQRVHPGNLSPDGIVVQYLMNTEKDKKIALLKKQSGRTKVLIPDEIEQPAGIDRRDLVNAIFVSGSAMAQVEPNKR